MSLQEKKMEMLRLAITDPAGHVIAAKDVTSAAELMSLAEQARAVIRECERLAHAMQTTSQGGLTRQAPYSN
jgi:hypothetical protein